MAEWFVPDRGSSAQAPNLLSGLAPRFVGGAAFAVTRSAHVKAVFKAAREALASRSNWPALRCRRGRDRADLAKPRDR
jgi:hypothetical protein